MDDHDANLASSLRSNPLWADVNPISQDDGPCPVAKIQYSVEFVEVYDYMRAILHSEEKSIRAFHLTERAARLNPANYTVWFYRRKLIRHLNLDLNEELRFLDEMIEMNPKNYQVWFHRQKIVELFSTPEAGDHRNAFGVNELKFVQSMLDEDAKNYHAWQYRQWLIKTYSLWEHELSYVEKLLKEDIRNNSAWSQRYFVISHTSDYTDEVRQKEIIYTLQAIDCDIYNESAWNYLRGITQNMDALFKYELQEPYCSSMLDHMRKLLRHENAPNAQLSPYLCMYAVSVYEEYLSSSQTSLSDPDRKDILQCELFPFLEQLETVDDVVRKNYWKFLRFKLQNQFNYEL